MSDPFQKPDRADPVREAVPVHPPERRCAVQRHLRARIKPKSTGVNWDRTMDRNHQSACYYWTMGTTRARPTVLTCRCPLRSVSPSQHAHNTHTHTCAPPSLALFSLMRAPFRSPSLLSSLLLSSPLHSSPVNRVGVGMEPRNTRRMAKIHKIK